MKSVQKLQTSASLTARGQWVPLPLYRVHVDGIRAIRYDMTRRPYDAFRQEHR